MFYLHLSSLRLLDVIPLCKAFFFFFPEVILSSFHALSNTIFVWLKKLSPHLMFSQPILKKKISSAKRKSDLTQNELEFPVQKTLYLREKKLFK